MGLAGVDFVGLVVELAGHLVEAANNCDAHVQGNDGYWEANLRVVRERHFKVVLALFGDDEVGYRAHEREVARDGGNPSEQDPRQVRVADGVHERFARLDTVNNYAVGDGGADEEGERHVVEDIAANGDDGGESADPGDGFDVHERFDVVQELSRDFCFLQAFNDDEEAGEEYEQLPIDTGKNSVWGLVVADGVQEHGEHAATGRGPTDVKVGQEASEGHDNSGDKRVPEAFAGRLLGERAEHQDLVAFSVYVSKVFVLVAAGERRRFFGTAAVGGAVEAGLSHLFLCGCGKGSVLGEVVLVPNRQAERVDSQAHKHCDQAECQELCKRDAGERSLLNAHRSSTTNVLAHVSTASGGYCARVNACREWSFPLSFFPLSFF